jgi:peptidoglycan/LPS O-acetylase OafA/YrhL
MKSLATAYNSPRGSFRPDIEGLRGIAVVLVVLFHTGLPGFRGGYIGVDVFFALSGYLITGLIVSEIEKTGAFSFRNFYARRVRRLLPASGLMVLGVLVAGIVLYSPLELSQYAIWGAYTSSYVSNLMCMREAGNYFSGNVTENPFLHTWSLAVEEQFYLLWPALIAFVFLRSRSRRRLAVSLSAVTALSLGACIWITYVRQSWAFYSLPTRAWEFGAGGLACLFQREALSGKEKWLKVLSWAGFAGLLGSVYFFDAIKLVFPGYLALVPVGGSLAMLLEGASGNRSILQEMLAWPLMQWIGGLAYSWYLWHWPFLIYAKACFPGLRWYARLLVAAGALLMAQLTYWFLENPVRFSPFLVAKPALSLGMAVLVPAVGFTAALGASYAASKSLANGEQRQFEAATGIGPWRDCLEPTAASRFTECVFGDPKSTTNVVLVGDSHAAQWFSAVNSIAAERHWRLVTLLKGNCQVAALEKTSDGRFRYARCEAWRARALERIAALSPAMVVLGESSSWVASGRPVTPEQWGDGLRATLTSLDAIGTKTLVMADPPYSSFDVPVCLSRASAGKWGARPCVTIRAIGLNEPVRDQERAVVSGDANARWVDFSDLFCAGSYCQPVVDNVVAYRDNNHISEALASHLAPRLRHEMNLLMEPPGSGTIAAARPESISRNP